MKIEDVGYIKRLNRLMSDTLKLYGFNVPEETEENQMHFLLPTLILSQRILKS